MSSFPSTQWSFVTRLREADPADKCHLIHTFLVRYLPPMRAFLQQRFHMLSEHDREDLLQDFVADQIIQRSLIEWAQRERGKLRSFLSRSLQNFAISWHRRQAKHAVHFHNVAEDVTQLRGAAQTVDAFDLAWARHVLSESVIRMKDECHDTGRQLMWDVFDLRVIRPLVADIPALSYEQLAIKLDADVRHLRNLLISAKRLLQRRARDVVSEYVQEPEAIEQEIHDLFRIASAKRSPMLSRGLDV